MTDDIIVSNLIDRIPENAEVGTEVAVISVAKLGVSLVSAELQTIIEVDYGGITGSWEYGSSAFSVIGTKVVLAEPIDYEEFGNYYPSYSIQVTAHLSDGTTEYGYHVFSIEDVIEDKRGTNKSETIYGTFAKDKIIAGAGDDVVWGRGGDDVLYGGAGADKLHGEAGADTFLFKKISESTVKSPDIIYGWQHTSTVRDAIDLKTIDARSDYSGDQPFKWLGTKAFDGKKGELRYEYKNGDTYVSADLNGDKHPDFLIRVDGTHKMYGDDFLL